MLVPSEQNDKNAFSAEFLEVWRVLEDVEDCEHARLTFFRTFPGANSERFVEVVYEWTEALSPILTK